MMKAHCSKYGLLTFQIRYIRSYETGLHEVTTLHDGQTIVVFPATMRRVLGIDPRASVGCREITAWQAEQIGFIVKRERTVAAI